MAVLCSPLWGYPVFKQRFFRATSCLIALACAAVQAGGCQNVGPPEGSATDLESINAPVADAGAGTPSCSVTLVAKDRYQPPATTDGNAKSSQLVPFAIPFAIPVTAGGASSAKVEFTFRQGAARKVTCAYELAQHGASSLSFKSCPNRDKPGAMAEADSFRLHVVSATAQSPAQAQIQITLALHAFDGTPCAGSNACLGAYACQNGNCIGSNPVTCAAPDQCHSAGVCDPLSGKCSNPTLADGTPCNDGNACTQLDTCIAGVCQGSNPVACAASDACHTTGTCDPTTGGCSNPAAADGTACNDGNACTQTDACMSGTCSGGNPILCVAIDQCHAAGICDLASGSCSNPTAPDGTICSDGDPCTAFDMCTAGQCAGTPGACGSDGAAAASDGSGDAADSGDDASDSSIGPLGDALPEGGAGDAALTDALAASDTNDEFDSTVTSDAATGAVDAAGDHAGDGPPPPPGPPSVGITWASIANVYLEFGTTSMLIDGYITRLPASDFFGGGGGLAFTHSNFSSDETAIGDVLAALGGPTRINWLFTGHSHWDHTFDTATWARLTGAPIYGPRTTCFDARAEGTPVAGCTAVVGGEKLQIAPGVTVRVVRWNHSGDSTSNPEQHNPVELPAVPKPDAQGRLRAGVAEDFPNGGGSRGFLFTVDSAAGAYSFFFQDTAGAGDLTQPVIVDGVNYGAPLSNLAAALADASLTHVDLWIATGGAPVAQLVVPLLHPKAYLPVHWDGLFRAFDAGAPAFSDGNLSNYLGSHGVRLVTPVQYMDKWSLSPSGIVPVDNKQVQQALGF